MDFWRVEAVVQGRLLRLRAEMKLPGKAWLQFEAQPIDGQTTCLTQTALFVLTGLAGLLYWYLLYPLHSIIWSALIRKIALLAQNQLEPLRKLPAV